MRSPRISSTDGAPFGISPVRPRWKRKAKGNEVFPLSSLGRKLRIWIPVCATIATTGYFMWQQRALVLPLASSTTAPAAAHAPAKLDTSIPIPVPGKPPEGRNLLARAQLQNELLYTDLQSFVCNEHIDRFKGSLEGDNAHTVDTVTSKVSFENGVERYSDIRQNNRERAAFSALPGAWSEGEFGTLLRQTKDLLGTQAVTLKQEMDLEGAAAAEYELRVGEAESPWTLVINAHEYRIPFETDVWVSKATGQMLKIERSSTQLPPETGISELRWSVSLQPMTLNDKIWLLPKTGTYEVSYANTNHKEWNVMKFSDYRRYSAQTILHF